MFDPEEGKLYLVNPLDDDGESLEHYGMPRRSGRYPWGSGDNPYQHEGYFEKRYKELKDAGYSDKEMAEALGMSINEMRAAHSIHSNEEKANNIAQAKKYREHGYSAEEIARKMNQPASTVRGWLKAEESKQYDQNKLLADRIKVLVDQDKFVDIGKGVSNMIGVSDQRLKNAVALLKSEGYEVHDLYTKQVTNPGQSTTVKVICPPGTTKKDVARNQGKLAELEDFTEDGGETYHVWERPVSVDSKRIYIRYPDEGGDKMDGVIELRRGVPDLDMGGSSYAQTRIAVDGTHYLKGMAIYSNDIPKGYDIVFNTSKTRDQKVYGEVFKEMKKDPDNPFGSLLRKDGQHYYEDPATGEKKLSVINKVRQEGDWEDWRKSLASQFLSKQPLKLINQQLNLSYADKAAELDKIESLTNPVIKRKMLSTFADDCDAAAVHLKASPLPGQKMQVILPVKTMKDTEIYAPNFKGGSTVALIRYPHGGTFEIPILTVNNKHKDGIDILGQAKDAVGISSKVAQTLSGADFDGDTVMVIPVTDSSRIVSTPRSLYPGLEDFDPHTEYKGYEGMQVLSKKNTQAEMGKITNLISDMTLKGASNDEISRAVKHSMVVIDATKHKLDYKRSFRENGIAELKTIYQGGPNAGASTLITQAKSQYRVPERKEGIYVTDPSTGTTRLVMINPKTGEKLYTPTGRTKRVLDHVEVDPETGKEKKVYVDSGEPVLQMSTKMAETSNAFDLSSGTEKENAYAVYANNLKALANRARIDILNSGRQVYSPTAYETYKKEVNSLVSKLNESLKNNPRERLAQTLANQRYEAARDENPELFEDKDDQKKYRQKMIVQARAEVNAHRVPIDISDREWEAIQAGAVSQNRLEEIISKIDDKRLMELALPKNTSVLSDAQISRIKAMRRSGYTTEEIANEFGVSTSTILEKLKD